MPWVIMPMASFLKMIHNLGSLLDLSLPQDSQGAIRACCALSQFVAGQKAEDDMDLAPDTYVFDTSMLFDCNVLYLRLSWKTTQKHQLVHNPAANILSREKPLSSYNNCAQCSALPSLLLGANQCAGCTLQRLNSLATDYLKLPLPHTPSRVASAIMSFDKTFMRGGRSF